MTTVAGSEVGQDKSQKLNLLYMWMAGILFCGHYLYDLCHTLSGSRRWSQGLYTGTAIWDVSNLISF